MRLWSLLIGHGGMGIGSIVEHGGTEGKEGHRSALWGTWGHLGGICWYFGGMGTSGGIMKHFRET